MLISIVIPVYNVERFLETCLESIRKQSFVDFEVILVNDGSTDSSSEICDKYSQKDSRFKVLHKNNGGQSTARNLGVKHASGEYLVFIDSDDFFVDNDCLKIIAEGLQSRPDILAYKYYKYYSDSRQDDCGIDMSQLNSLDKKELIKELISRDSFFCSCWSKAVLRSILIDNRITFDESLSCEDMDWYFNVVKNSKTIRAIDYPIINYRQREGSVTSGKFRLKTLEGFIYTINKWRAEFESIESTDERYIMLSALAKLYCNLLISFSTNRHEASVLKKAIFKHKSLLSYNLNPRTKSFYRAVSVIGLNMFTNMLNYYTRLRR